MPKVIPQPTPETRALVEKYARDGFEALTDEENEQVEDAYLNELLRQTVNRHGIKGFDCGPSLQQQQNQ